MIYVTYLKGSVPVSRRRPIKFQVEWLGRIPATASLSFKLPLVGRAVPHPQTEGGVTGRDKSPLLTGIFEFSPDGKSGALIQVLIRRGDVLVHQLDSLFGQFRISVAPEMCAWY